MFPGVRVHDRNRKEKGWNMNVYSPADFRNLMGTDVIARIGSSVAELIQKGDLKIHVMYNVLEGYPRLSFPKTAARRR